MSIFVWIVIFIASLIVLVKGADWLLDGAEKIGVAVGFSPFIVGVVIVGVGTSFPELISGIVAIMQNTPEIVAANAIGSNIANIFLVVGVAAIVAGKLSVTKNLIDLDLPLVALATVLFLGVVPDEVISRPEAVLLLLGYSVYFVYIIQAKKGGETAEPKDIVDIIPPPRHKPIPNEPKIIQILRAPEVVIKNIGVLFIGAVGLAIGAKYLIDAVIALSSLLSIGPEVIALFAVAFGTSLPEILVSFKAARQRKSEVALGNIFGSNVFNLLVVIGLPGLFVELPIDVNTIALGIPVMVAATALFVISGISQRIHSFEGYMYLLIYILFLGKLFGLF